MKFAMIDRLATDGRRLTHVTLAIIILWLVAEFVLLGPAGVVVTGSNGELVVPALLSGRYAEIGRELWQAIASSGDDKTTYTFYNPIDLFLFTTLPGWLAHGLRISSVLLGALLGAYAIGGRDTAARHPLRAFSIRTPVTARTAFRGRRQRQDQWRLYSHQWHKAVVIGLTQ